jgi:hypothetical protein
LGIAIAAFATIDNGFDVVTALCLLMIFMLATAAALTAAVLLAAALEPPTPASPIKPSRAKCLATLMAAATGAAFATAIFGFHVLGGGHT